MLTIRSAKFITSLTSLTAFEGQGLPEIAMAGKSNVGKSTMINRVTGNGKLARTSSEPGKTRLINLYNVNDSVILTDLPGYGFAKAPQSEKKKWAQMIEGYLSGNRNLKRVLMLVDMRHEPTQDDAMMMEYLRHYELPFTVIATKADKLSKAAQGRAIPIICRKLVVQPWQIIPFSGETGQGRDKILELMEQTVAEQTSEGEAQSLD